LFLFPVKESQRKERDKTKYRWIRGLMEKKEIKVGHGRELSRRY
jgi:hypothetical protein